ncbi:hypothetical protein HDV00_005066 [Rhizophlyctis rosea]|nr:hypothetical protein HDV00_005066 [Rhizophlyctis rosea]
MTTPPPPYFTCPTTSPPAHDIHPSPATSSPSQNIPPAILASSPPPTKPLKDTTPKDLTASSSPRGTKAAFPHARVKTIMKEDKDVTTLGNDAVFAVAYATELFLAHLAQKSYTFTREDKNRKAISYKDIANAITKHDDLEFLADVVPHPVPISQALQRRKVADKVKEPII